MKRLFMILLTFTIMAGCQVCFANSDQPSTQTKDVLNKYKFANDEISKEEYQIFSLVLSEIKSKEILVDKEVRYLSFEEVTDKEIIRTLKVGKLQLPQRITILSLDDFWKNGFSFDGWINFHKKYPSGVIYRLSRVGFNENKNQAILEISFMADRLAGRGFYVYLTKEENTGKWKVTNREATWIS